MFKIDFQVHSHAGHLLHWNRTVSIILVESQPGNIPVKFEIDPGM